MSKTDSVYLFHIRDSINKILDYTKASEQDGFYSNPMMQDAVIRQIEIIGEASAKLSKMFRDDNPQIPWKNIIGMRNKLIHDYFGVDVQAVWATVENDIPSLKTAIDLIVSNLDQPLNFLK
jgi:uncharacterized protein with HEPN domain